MNNHFYIGGFGVSDYHPIIFDR